MKITKRKIVEQAGNSYYALHWKGEDGKLIKHSKDDTEATKIEIGEHLKRLEFEKSLKHQLCGMKRNKLSELLDYLTKKQRDKRSDIDKILRDIKKNHDSKEIKELVEKSLTPRGRKITFARDEDPNDRVKLCEELVTIINDTDREKALQLQKSVQNAIEKRRQKIEKSLTGNRLYFAPKGGGETNPAIKPKLRQQWLEGLFDTNAKALDIDKIEKLANEYGIDDLIKKMIDFMKEQEGKENKSIPYRLHEIRSSHEKNIFQKKSSLRSNGKNEPDDVIYYIDEVRRYMHRIAPVSKKNKGSHGIRNIKINDFNNAKEIIAKQMINQLTQHLIFQGKCLAYNVNTFPLNDEKKLVSEELQQIQIEEAFKKQLLNAVAWGINRLRFLMTDDNDDISIFNGDIIGKGVFEKAYKSIKGESILKIQNVFGSGVENQQIFEYIRNAISGIRIATFHFKQGELIGKLKDISVNKSLDKNVTSPLSVEDLYEKDLDALTDAFQRKLCGSGIGLFYSKSTLERLLKKLQISLDIPVLPLIPSFKRIFEKGLNLNQGCKIRKPWMPWFIEVQGEEGTVYRNLLGLIFKYSFLPSIEVGQKTDAYISQVVEKVRKWNKEESHKNARNEAEQYKYEEIPEFKNSQTLEQYLFSLQGLLVQNENENNARNSNKVSKDKFNDFVCDLFTFLFGEYLDTHFKGQRGELQTLEKNTEGNYLDLKEKTTLEKIELPRIVPGDLEKEDCPSQSLYLLAKLLDPKNLNLLIHQFIRYATSRKSISDIEDNSVKIIQMLRLIDITRLSPLEEINSDENPDKEQQKLRKDLKRRYEKNYGDFIEGSYKAFKEVYVQSDDETLIYKAGIENTRQIGLLQSYKNIYPKITKEEYDEYINKRDNEIVNWQSKKRDLHKKLVKSKVPLNPNTKDYEDYRRLVEETSKYNHLARKINFIELGTLGKIHLEILSRLIGFVNDWERDLFFLLVALREKDLINAQKDEIGDLFSKGYICREIGKFFKENGQNDSSWKNIVSMLLTGSTQGGTINQYITTMEIRNWISHINHIQTKKGTNTPSKSLITAINELRELLAYDRKRKNAVTKSIKDLLKKEKIVLVLETQQIERHKFRTKEIKSDGIEHLKKVNKEKRVNGKAVIKENAHDLGLLTVLKSELFFDNQNQERGL
ncbi:MAG: type VI-A CRISPR-associated RNA-guided ribonuclease Cas13a [Eubacteriaceae bacterium]